MTDQAAARGRTYQSGDWYGVIGPNVVVVLPPQEKSRVAAVTCIYFHQLCVLLLFLILSSYLQFQGKSYS